MIPIVIVGLISLVLVLAGLLLAAYVVMEDQGKIIVEFRQDRDLARQEVQVLTDAIARGNRTPILREVQQKQPLEKTASYWDGHEQITRITAL